jgi:phosphopantothenoylcysteine decarboxylase/phosphopantothenate--cysteine ligase
MLSGKKIILGVTGSIAAYKAAVLTRLLVKSGAEVQVICTSAAKEFITPLTLSTLSKKPVYSEFVANSEGEWNNHVELGLWADVVLIAPASANTLAKMANGICDNLLLATYLSAKCPVFFAPAMDLDMYQHPTTKQNITKLADFGNHLIKPNNGELASGLSGEGRMAEPEEIVEELTLYFSKNQPLQGKKVLVSAGPTYENLDPVRFIGNYSSGKMGYAIAEQFAKQGAEVTLVSGPTHLAVQSSKIKRIDVVSAKQMFTACAENAKTADIIVMAAAVADYTPVDVAAEKIKKAGEGMNIELTKTTDILKELGKQKSDNQILVGFALETTNELEHAKKKLENKNLDFIVLNSMKDKGAGFGVNTNKVTFIDKQGIKEELPLKTKQEVALDIVNKIISLL